MRRPVRVLHVASFDGNIGDNANHLGVRERFAQTLPTLDLGYTQFEIRETFWRQRAFDEAFAAEANAHDLVIFGGGNFFELWVERSCNGTSVDLPIALLESIRTPILFHALGLDVGMGAPAEHVIRFKAWLDYVLPDTRYLVSVRNDGAIQNGREVLGAQYADRIHSVPDGGFFYRPPAGQQPEIQPGARTIGVNIAGDMLEQRFPGGDKLDYAGFVPAFAKVCSDVLDEHEDVRLVFFPHIYRDLRVAHDVLAALPDWHVRRRVSVAPYLHGDGGAERVFAIYRDCALVMGNRFHANVCPIGLGVPTIGLLNYPQVGHLYRELEIDDRLVDVRDQGFAQPLSALLGDTLVHRERVVERYQEVNRVLDGQLTAFHGIVSQWLSNNGL
ncbi:MAG: polysaccharide pyruvyl transferase family protein [Sandaracinaceae bacterium]|nr:polysaccharide pyruvyl transferase family protein [Sandaracinaceae bacterium]